MTQHHNVRIEMKISLCIPKELVTSSRFRVSSQFLTPYSYSPLGPSRLNNVILVLRRISPWEFYWSPFGTYDCHIRLDDVPLKKIHLVLGISSFLDLFD